YADQDRRPFRSVSRARAEVKRGPVRMLNLAAIGQVAWIPFLTATLGTLAGGWFSGALLKDGKPHNGQADGAASRRCRNAARRVRTAGLAALAGEYSQPTLAGAIRQLQSAAEARTRRSLREIPDGTYFGEDFLDDDGVGGPPTLIAVRVEKQADRLHLDFG